MTDTTAGVSPEREAWATFFHISRFHIIVIAACASLTFSWIFTGEHNLIIPLLVGFDWFLVNLMNRVVDLAEDQLNAVEGTGFVARNARALTWLCGGLMVASFPLVYLLYPELTGYRLVFHLIGLAYNYKIIPWPGGLTRFKELYFFKNFGSAVLFILSGIVYPVAAANMIGAVPLDKLLLMIGFFLCMDLTYEIFYDLRDLPGDTALGVPTFPVAHGEQGAYRIVVGLLIGAAALLIGGYAYGALAFKEVVMVAAVIQQAIYFQVKVKKGLTQADCVFVTYLGAIQLVSYNLWIWAGLPLDLTAFFST